MTVILVRNIYIEREITKTASKYTSASFAGAYLIARRSLIPTFDIGGPGGAGGPM